MATTKAKGTPVQNGAPVIKYKCGFPVEIILPRTNTDAEFYEGLEDEYTGSKSPKP